MADRRGIAARVALARDDGFTLIELMVAIMVLAVGLIALVTSFDHSRDLVSVAEKTEVASHRAEQELERILSLPYDTVAHASTPASSADPSDPASFVSGTSYQYDQGSTGPQSETLAAPATGAPAGGVVGVAPQTWNDSESRLTGRIQSFITWTGDYCTAADRTACAKRVTVAVTVGGPSPLRRHVVMSTVMTSPVGTGS
ncbi:MAG TPA: prepilin-type N-terminal cleavage/methylation domain-containing protein [Thermoleophilaceae bacterium]|nr:prepilin-type N-terminal cleavage/methylation domain-containing protein [Thermoleophilaceae bacterium]